MSIDLEKIKNAKGRTYVSCDNPEAIICVEDWLEYQAFSKELGIDLLVLLKAKRDGVYWRFRTRMGTLPHPGIINFGRVGCVSFDNKSLKVGGVTCKLCDYGVTWALTKEELK